MKCQFVFSYRNSFSLFVFELIYQRTLDPANFKLGEGLVLWGSPCPLLWLMTKTIGFVYRDESRWKVRQVPDRLQSDYSTVWWRSASLSEATVYAPIVLYSNNLSSSINEFDSLRTFDCLLVLIYTPLFAFLTHMCCSYFMVLCFWTIAFCKCTHNLCSRHLKQ